MESLQKRWNDWISSFKKKKKNASGADEKANIQSAEIVYVFGPSGAGKSFTGDYMAVVHGYHHVDGDIPIKHVALVPEYKEIFEKVIIDGDSVPLYSELARLTLEAAKEHTKVVLSHASEKNEERDHVVKTLIEGGVSKDNITLIQLTIDPKVKAHGWYHRLERQVEQAGATVTEAWKILYPEFEGELTEEMFVEWFLTNPDNPYSGNDFEDHPDATMVNVSGRDVTHFDNLDKALGLTRSSDLTYEGVCAEVLPIDAARDAKTVTSGGSELLAEITARAAAKAGDNSLVIDEEGKDEKKVEEMKKRRSSLVELDRLSTRNLSVRNTSEGVEMRRKSFIKTGKVGDE